MFQLTPPFLERDLRLLDYYFLYKSQSFRSHFVTSDKSSLLLFLFGFLHAFSFDYSIPLFSSIHKAPLRRLIRKEPQGELFSRAFLFDSSRQYGLFFEENFLNIVYNLLRRISLPKWISYRCHLIISELIGQ